MILSLSNLQIVLPLVIKTSSSHGILKIRRQAILYSHGNAIDIGGLKHLQDNFYRHGYSIIIYDYSGYRLSEGEASEEQVYNDVAAVYAYLIKHEKPRSEQIISYGYSLGTAVATDPAFKNPVADP